MKRALELVGLVGLVGLVASATPARASTCAIPAPRWSPSGGAVPPRPTLYWFGYLQRVPPRVRVLGARGPVPITLRKLRGSHALVYALDIAAERGPLRLEVDGRVVARYRIARPAPAPSPRLIDIGTWDALPAGTGHAVTYALAAPAAAAVVVRWADGVSITLAPERDAPPPPDGRVVIAIGSGCVTDPAPDDHLGRPVAGLDVLYADGTDHAVDVPPWWWAPGWWGSAP